MNENNCIDNNLFTRYEGNPIITPNHWPYMVNSTFNPGAIRYNNKILLLIRVEDMRGFSHLTLARSKDGKTGWDIDKTPTIKPNILRNEERWGVEDPRIVWLEERQQYAISYVSFSKDGPVVSLALTKDFKTFDHLGAMLPPEDKDASLFPRLINGKYVMIHRPIIRGEAHIWIAFSPDLTHWGEHKILIPVRPGWWDSHRVGLGTPPIETDEGWLLIYHGTRITASGSLYRVGLALLDLDEPWKIIRRCDNWVFGPCEDYERIGDVPGVTFPVGVIINEKTNELMMYYGAADTSVCLAIANLDDVLNYVLKSSKPTECEF
ncbi:MAG: glycosidase [Methanosarcinaceae archaeon]|nr:glycosidase [Methanosarcinaceae archaeon]NKQ39048.1 glycosidase [Methanosarcinales archaeon]